MRKNYKKDPRAIFVLIVCLLLSVTVGITSEPVRLRRASGDPSLAKVSTEEAEYCPGGMGFGVRLATKGVLVVGFSSPSGGESAAKRAGLCLKDIIERIDGKAVNTAAEVTSLIESCGGRAVTLQVLRGEDTLQLTFTPERDSGGCYKAGMWVRDSTAGIGTVTLVRKNDLAFLGLGHGICDGDTGALMPLLKGNVYDIDVVAVRKGKTGAPGELKGYFSDRLKGLLLKNTACGVLGRFSEYDGEALPEPMPLARRSEVRVGDASIFCTLSDGVRREYGINIVKITSPDGDTKNFLIEVDDPALLELTGGIVQGMSGSPIIQNGKIVGAVTHVTVSDPTRGYGIFIDNMIGLMG